jgi:hypothetical protein
MSPWGRGGGGLKSAEKCHVLFEWFLTLFNNQVRLRSRLGGLDKKVSDNKSTVAA